MPFKRTLKSFRRSTPPVQVHDDGLPSWTSERRSEIKSEIDKRMQLLTAEMDRYDPSRRMQLMNSEIDRRDPNGPSSLSNDIFQSLKLLIESAEMRRRLLAGEELYPEEVDLRVERPCNRDCFMKRAWNAPHKMLRLSGNGLVGTSVVSTESSKETLYSPLGPLQIRLLRILPASDHDTLVCELALACSPIDGTVELADAHASHTISGYDALSYSWGRLDLSGEMICNSINVRVSEHLKAALLHLRHETSERYVWVDSFCINQNDLQEKASQVQRMFEIFRSARTVVGWLGPTTDEDFQLMSYLEARAADVDSTAHSDGQPQSSMRSDRKRYWSYLHDLYQNGHMPGIQLEIPKPGDVSPDMACQMIQKTYAVQMHTLLSRTTWFARTWIRQEVFAAKHLVLVRGRYIFDIETLETVRRELDVHPSRAFSIMLLDHLNIIRHPHPTETPVMISDRESMNALGKRYYDSLRWMHSALENAQVFCATVGHDQLFSLQNILEQNVAPDERFLEVNYEQTVHRLFERFVKLLADRLYGLEILTIFERRDGPHDPQLPSWVPDFRVDKVRITFQQARPLNDFDLRRRPVRPVLGLDMNEFGVLRLRGTQFGKITSPCPHKETHGCVDLMLNFDKTRCVGDIDLVVTEKVVYSGKLEHASNVVRLGSTTGTDTGPEGVHHEDERAMLQLHHLSEAGYVCWRYQSTCATLQQRCQPRNAPYDPMAEGQEFNVLAVSNAQVGDLIVGFETAHSPVMFLRDNGKCYNIWTGRQAYLLRRVSEEPERYRFLGPCMPFYLNSELDVFVGFWSDEMIWKEFALV